MDMGSIMDWMQSGHSAISHLWARWQAEHQVYRPVVGRRNPGPASIAVMSRVRPQRPEKIVVVRMDGRPGPLIEALEQTGYQVITVQGVAGAVASLEYGVALVIVIGPEVSDTCVALRQGTAAPILALLPELSESAVLDAFNAGADDCQLATIGPHEAVLRVAALLRRDRQRSAYGRARAATS
jgi:hypothetical protein